MTLKVLQNPSLPLDLAALPSTKPLQFLLTVKNPMFDPVRVTLATPARTPGRFGSRVTILCPQFEIGANTDVWDEALNSSDSRRASKLVRPRTDGDSDGKIAEAGKVWEKGRNWTVVVVEVICARLEVLAEGLEEDEDVLEIPVFVRIEYETDAAGDDGGAVSTEKEKREKHELAYWCVLGVGKITLSPIITIK
jgi:dynactin-4